MQITIEWKQSRSSVSNEPSACLIWRQGKYHPICQSLHTGGLVNYQSTHFVMRPYKAVRRSWTFEIIARMFLVGSPLRRSWWMVGKGDTRQNELPVFLYTSFFLDDFKGVCIIGLLQLSVFRNLSRKCSHGILEFEFEFSVHALEHSHPWSLGTPHLKPPRIAYPLGDS